jgi:hypothetical protein
MAESGQRWKQGWSLAEMEHRFGYGLDGTGSAV